MFDERITAGATFLAKNQQKDGSFLSSSSVDPQNFIKPRTFHTTFATSLILSCMNKMTETPRIRKLKKHAANYLLSQKSNDWSFNYWDRASREAKIMPYPDDLDDTFCALAALFEYKPQLLDGAAFAKIISLLTATEIQEGGPYYTWLVGENSPEVWKDIDIAVNSNVAYFLSLQEIELPNMNTYIDSAILAGKLTSPYYYSSLPIIYFISKFYKGALRSNLIKILLTRTDNHDTALQNALRILALLNLGVSPKEILYLIESLLTKQINGKWEPSGFYVDPVIEGKQHYAGSFELTTSFCVLALDRFSSLLKEQTNQTHVSTETAMTQQLRTAIIANVKQRFHFKDRQLKSTMEEVLHETLQGAEADQIMLLPYYITLSGQPTKKIPQSLLIQAGTASLYGWMAYTIYDNFLDDEGEPRTLPVANIALRELTAIFTTLLKKNDEFIHFFNQTMDQLELANSWEVSNCRLPLNSITITNLPDYGNYAALANRSMGHAIAPVAVLFYLGYNSSSLEVKQLLKFFHHYIIARQLNDDAHDFEEDLQHGHINAVSVVVLKALLERKNLPVDPSALVKMVKEQFWQESVVFVSHDVLRHTKKARKALIDNPFIRDRALFDQILDRVESSANKALEEHKNVMSFLHSYQAA